MTKRDFYEVLEIERTADPNEIKSAYRKLARKYHPDVNPNDPSAEDRFKEVQAAYEVLSDDSKRQVYDRYGHEAPGGFPGAGGGPGFSGGFGDIFDIFFNGAQGGGRGGRGGPQRGADMQYNLEVSLEEAFSGVEKQIRVPRVETCDTCKGNGAAPGTTPETCTVCGGQGQVRHTQNTILGTFQTMAPCSRCNGRGKVVKTPCPECQGQGRIRRTRDLTISVPAGVDNDMQMPLKGEGEAGLLGGPSGDLYVEFHVKPHPLFERRGRDLFTEVPISFTQAALGDEITITTVGGDSGAVTVPEGTQTGTIFRLRGQGMPDVLRGSAQRGDLNVAVKVEIPTKLDDEEKKLLRQLAALRGEKAAHEPKGFFERVKEAVLGHDE
ncbi:MAG: molecular chaperone DnaJ [Cytophagales bacterium]|nr:molecular chaperone DnaJ [Armatimonadota bacterium]